MREKDFELFKQYTRTDDTDDKDDLLRDLLDSAEEYVVNATHRPREELEEMGCGDYPRPLRQAIFMLAGYWFSQVETAGAYSVNEVPFGTNTLIKQYRKLV